MIFVDVRFCGFDDCDFDGEVEVDRDMESTTDFWSCPVCKAEHIEYMDDSWFDAN